MLRMRWMVGAFGTIRRFLSRHGALLAAVPVADPEVEAARPRAIISGEVPSATNPPPGCRFHTRCPQAFARCRTQSPELRDLGGGQAVACHLHDTL